MEFIYSRQDVFTNARIKYFRLPDGTLKKWSVTVFPEKTFKKNGFEVAGWNTPELSIKGGLQECIEDIETDENNAKENLRKSFNRAKNNLFDLLMANLDLDYFCTLTFSAEALDRYDYKEIIKKLDFWLDNRVRRKGLKYVLVPELHKDGAVHFHGLMNASALRIEKARNAHNGKLLKTSKNKQIYNILDFSFGFSTAIQIGNGVSEREACAKYIYKYITKTHGEKVGGRYYLSGGKLARAVYEFADIDYYSLDVEPFRLSYGGEVKILRCASDFEN